MAKYSKAAKAELEKDFNQAFRLYVKAAEDFLHLSRTCPNSKLRATCKTQAGKALERAEKIKVVKQDLVPVAKNAFSEQEQLFVLQKSSIVNKNHFPMWDERSHDISSTAQPPLSADQVKNAAAWRRLPQTKLVFPVCIRKIPAGSHAILKLGYMSVESCSMEPTGVSADPHRRQITNLSGWNFDVYVNGFETPALAISPGKGRGYDFPGSDSSIDLHALAGWIPEQIEIRSPRFQREKTWLMILDGYTKALSRFRILRPYWLKEREGERLLTIFDPWLHGLDVTNIEMEAQHSRAFHLSWDAVCDLFDSIYLSWDPAIFQHQLHFHGMWKREDIKKGDNSSHVNLRLQSNIEQTDQTEYDVWIQLTRHVVETSRKSEYISLLVHNGGEADLVTNMDALSLKGEYTNCKHILIRTHLSGLNRSLSMIASYDGDSDCNGFTVTVYSHHTMSWIEDSWKALYSKELEGAFTSKTGGGNPTYPTFMLNPQYHLRILPDMQGPTTGRRSAKARTSVVVRGDRHVPMNITLVWSQGERVSEMGHNDVAVTSGPYSYGYVHAAKDLAPGDYTLIISAFEPRHLGQFSLHVDSSHRFDVNSIPQEGAGMFTKVIRGAWAVETAGGSPSFKKYASNPAYELKITTATQIQIRLQLVEPSSTTSLNITLFHATRSAALGTHVVTSGPYSDAISGVVTPRITLQPGKYIAIPSTYNPGIRASFKMIVYSTNAVNVVPIMRT
ncbi:Calpain-like protease palB/RIM13 [Grifola frondosa]|uniref:Calpain-like protease palB/RIM13 n=1 Tax=Grifola frondosa TaxID=5627 RepID=A0A1C7LY15_GRIFR|nr:Calpain-like protease palB/RIM13 [Grifola frondosa]